MLYTIIIISLVTGLVVATMRYRTPGQLVLPVSVAFQYLGWKVERYSFMRSMCWASTPSGDHHSPSQTTAVIVCFEVSRWTYTVGRGFNQGKPSPWPLASLSAALCPVMPYHHRSGYSRSVPCADFNL